MSPPSILAETPARGAAADSAPVAPPPQPTTTSVDSTALDLDSSADPLEDFARVPGLLRRWEVQQVVQAEGECRVLEAGELADKTPLFAVYRRAPAPPPDADVGLPVQLSLGDGGAEVPARLLPIGVEPLMAVVVFEDGPNDAGVLAQVREHLVRPARPGETGRRRDADPPGQERVL